MHSNAGIVVYITSTPKLKEPIQIILLLYISSNLAIFLKQFCEAVSLEGMIQYMCPAI